MKTLFDQFLNSIDEDEIKRLKQDIKKLWIYSNLPTKMFDDKELMLLEKVDDLIEESTIKATELKKRIQKKLKFMWFDFLFHKIQEEVQL